MPPDYSRHELLGKVGPTPYRGGHTVSFCNGPAERLAIATRWLQQRTRLTIQMREAYCAFLKTRERRRKKLQGRRRGVEPNIEPSTDPEALRDAPRMGSNNATRLTIQMREAYCAFFNECHAVPWQPRA
ncbi:unnamed protein product [Arctogadus glacialis]